jgi:hypothetical protein
MARSAETASIRPAAFRAIPRSASTDAAGAAVRTADGFQPLFHGPALAGVSSGSLRRRAFAPAVLPFLASLIVATGDLMFRQEKNHAHET